MKSEATVFPISDNDFVTRGLTLRDYFAGQVLSALCVPPLRTNDIDWIAHRSYLIADAMLAEREKENA